jgi:hypothetical protein
MKEMTIIHIGDIHYPETKLIKTADIKEWGTDSPIVDSSAPFPLQNSIRKIQNLLGEFSVDGIALSGDLTSDGFYSGYKECVDYLVKSILGGIFTLEQERIHVVPGNHDVNEEIADETGHDLLGKFKPLHDIWDSIGLPVFMKDYSRITRITNDNVIFLQLVSINTCTLSCVLRGYPEIVLSHLNSEIEKARKSGDKSKLRHLLGEILDVSAVKEDDFQNVTSNLRALPENIQPIVLGHHNLIPQAVTRYTSYPEMINSGIVRRRLIECEKPIMYLHGHIHKDTIEVISDPKFPKSKLICISAPKLTDGFNLIRIEFGDNNTSIGCIVIPYISGDSCSFHKQGSIYRVPFYSLQDANGVCSQECIQIACCIPSEKIFRFEDILEMGKTKLNKHIPEDTMRDYLLEAQWFGIIKLESYMDVSKYGNIYKDPLNWLILRLPK